MEPGVRIFELGLYLRCPRLVYFDSLGSLPKMAPSPDYLLLRGIMLSLSELSQGDLAPQLYSILHRLEIELPLVHGTGLSIQALSAACKDIESEVPRLARSLQEISPRLLPCEVDLDLSSKRLGLSGRLDRLVDKQGGAPSVIRTGPPPQEGVWRRDRLQLAGYALLVQEHYDRFPLVGLVEYPRDGMVREVRLRATDRARVLRIRDRIRQIRKGRLPDRPKEARCDICAMRESCEPKVSLAARFF